jgi:hypothetical protein
MVVLSSCGGGSQHGAPSDRRGTQVSARDSRHSCQVSRGDLLTARQVPGFRQFVSEPNEPIPVHHDAAASPAFVRDYVCGEFYGFITDRALAGTYRQQNNALARHYGYRPGRWPLVPLRGAIVRQLKSQVLEIYESLYQFSAPGAARTYLKLTNSSAYSSHTLALKLDPGSLVVAHLMGPDPANDEHAIYIAVIHDDFVLGLELQGGRSLSWPDVRAYWIRLAPQVPTLGG